MGLLYEKEQKTAGRIPSAEDIRPKKAKAAPPIEIEEPEIDAPDASDDWEEELELVDGFSLEGEPGSEDDADDLF